MLTHEDFVNLVQNLTGTDVSWRAIALETLWQAPRGDPRILPYIETLLEDKTPCLLGIPYIFGEIRWLAAKALVAEREAQGIAELVYLPEVVRPLYTRDIIAAEHAANLDGRGGIEGLLESLAYLRDKGYLPMYALHLRPKVAREQTEALPNMPVLIPT